MTTAPGCPWNASGGAGWVTFPSPNNVGPGGSQFVVASNSGPPRTDTVTIAGQPFTVRQASQCTYVLVPPFANYDGNGGAGAILVIVTGPILCTWTASSTVPWVTVTNGASGSGGGLVQFTVAPAAGANRSGIILIGGQTFTVNQSR